MTASGGKKEMLVVFGGRSGEHEVSLRSAVSILKAASRARYNITPVGIDRDGMWYALEAFEAAKLPVGELPAAVFAGGYPAALVPMAGGAVLVALSATRKRTGAYTLTENEGVINCGDLGVPRELCRPHVAFPVLHGTYGEDGTIQGLFEMCGVPYVGAGVLGSSVGMDKEVSKRVLRDAGLEIVPFTVWHRDEPKKKAIKAFERELGYPVFVKPANMGSSVGISRASNRREMDAAMDLAAAYDRKVLVEKAVDAREIECAVLGNRPAKASVPGEILSAKEWYDYEAKYKAASRTLVPAKLPAKVASKVMESAVRAFEAIGCEGMARVDFFLERGTGRLYINELNTIPGFTSISMYAMMWKACGVTYPRLIDQLVGLALGRHADKQRNRVTQE
jgi:D-alanine-D-alanine ligase